MPLPEPMPNETEQQFVDRFMGDSQAVSDFPDEQQRSAVAYDTFREGKDLGFFFETKKYESIDFKPTEAMAKAAQRGLDMRKKQPPSNRGGTAVGLARARQLINRETLSPSTVKRMYSFFSRHEVDKQSDSWKKGNSKGEQAWLLWGGDPGFSWSKRKVAQMKKEDSKKGDIDLNIQHKDFFFEVKAVGEKGAFEGLASPYGNVDHGGDMVMPTIGPENNGNKVPLLWQHERKSIIGEGTLFNTPQGVKIKGNFFLDKIDGAFAVPKAAEAYMLAKKGVLKFSIGYMINPGGASHTPKGIRELKSIVIKEVSCVTFPMNDEAKIESVKTAENQHLDKCYNEENKSEGGAERLEVKARTCGEIMKGVDYRSKVYKAMDAMYESLNEIFTDGSIDSEDKKAMISKSLNEFVPMMNEAAYGYIDSMANMKSDEIPLESKEFKPVEEQKTDPAIDETMKKALEMARQIAKKGDEE